jgi:hypothetical protein
VKTIHEIEEERHGNKKDEPDKAHAGLSRGGISKESF